VSFEALVDCEFVTERLRVEPWHAVAQRHGFDLEAVIAE
jgi:hypothetical protein